MNVNETLNLARKWRSQNFDQIIGQDLVVRILKNSLYRGHFFPVYLFSGQRGCGKTTTARVFAKAVNCQEIEPFRKQPQQILLPCDVCQSCVAMQQGKHPDFIEIDAASHTGVDNVRSIIDAAALLPIIGEKKIYLIDEAHMLSKAAFNAFLKILEEPPATALFILATTDPEKIIETVRSRCFQLFFKPIATPTLVTHLSAICQREQIEYDEAALELIVQESEGSARDALNTLERVRFSAARVDRSAVVKLLGHVEDTFFVTLLAIILTGDVQKLLAHIQQLDRATCSARFVWATFVKLLHAAIRLKHGVADDNFQQLSAAIDSVVRPVHWKHLYGMLEHCYQYEVLLAQTQDQFSCLEMMLLQLCLGPSTANNDTNTGNNSGSVVAAPPAPLTEQQADAQEYDAPENSLIDEAAATSHGAPVNAGDGATIWQRCVHDMASLHDPMILSLYKQSFFGSYDAVTGVVQIEFEKRLSFFKDKLDDTESVWLPVVRKWFNDQARVIVTFNRVDGLVTNPVAQAVGDYAQVPKVTSKPIATKPATSNGTPHAERSYARSVARKKEHARDVPLVLSDMAAWPKAALLLQHFPGTLYEIQEQQRHG